MSTHFVDNNTYIVAAAVAAVAAVYTVEHKKGGGKLLSITLLANLKTDFDKFCTPITGNKFVTKCIHLLTYLF